MGKIVWLASYPKSGNTWTRTFLFNLFTNAREPRSINDIPTMSPSDVQAVWYHQLDKRDRKLWTLPEIARMRLPVQEAISRHTPDTIFVKTHCPLGMWQGVPLFNMNVTSGAIYIVRNPLDVVASYAHHAGMTPDEIIDAMKVAVDMPGSKDRVPHVIGTWSQNVASWTARPHPGLHVMRYEDMVADPRAAFGSLTRFLQLPQDEERLQRAIGFSSFEQLRAQESRDGFIERSEYAEHFFRRGEVGGWRRELTPQQVRRVVAAHGEQMARFGYLPEDA